MRAATTLAERARLTPGARYALAVLLDAEASCGGPDSGYAWASPSGTHVHTSTEGGWRQVAVDYRVVRRLLAAGLVDVESYDAHWDDVRLTDAGRELARRADASTELVSP